MRDSSYLRKFPLSTPYFTVKSDGTVINTTPNFAHWYAGLGMDEDTGIVFLEHGNPNNGLSVKMGFGVPALVVVPMGYIDRVMAAGGTILVVGPLTGAFTVPTPAANQNLFVFKNGTLQATAPSTIPASASDIWTIVLSNDKLAGMTPPPYSATLAASPLTGTHGTTVISFTLTETNKPSGATTSYAWDFGDGTAVTNTSTPTTTHTYAAAGSFTAKCTPTINGTVETQVTAAAPAVIS